MKLMLNGKDITNFVGEPLQINGRVYLPLTFLEKVMKQSNDAVMIDITEENLSQFFKMLSPRHPFPASLQLKAEKGIDGNVKAKAQFDIGESVKVLFDQDGKIEAGVNIKF